VKKIALLLTLVCLTLFAKAQTSPYGPVYLGIGGFKDSKGVSGDMTLELRGRVSTTSNFFFGLRFQLAGTPNSGYSSICISSDYYFAMAENGLRIFVGAGFGGFNDFKGATTDDFNFFNLNSSNFGFFPRIGIEAWRFRLSAEYNFTGGTDNYAAVNLGFFFGGRKKK
jgi:hypothetical protein